MAVAVGALVASACTDDEGDNATVVVTTSILGDVVANIVGQQAEVDVVMPRNVDPHEFAPSAKQAAMLREASVVVANGGGFEGALDDTIQAARDDGAQVLSVFEQLDVDGDDPHVFTDPVLMRDAVDAIAEFIAANVDGLDDDALLAGAVSYKADLAALDGEIRELVDPIAATRRVLVTNHEVFGRFAARYGFEVIGAIHESTSTLGEPSAADLAALAAIVRRTGVPAVFTETSSSGRLAEALAREAGREVEVVELFAESLGDADSEAGTYIEMLRTNAQRIAEALG